MDSQGKKVIVCDNGTGVSNVSNHISIVVKSRILSCKERFKMERDFRRETGSSYSNSLLEWGAGLYKMLIFLHQF